MCAFRVIRNSTIKESLEDTTRQYLVGDLKLPQKLKHIDIDCIEVGISKYKDADQEAPHYHTQAYEFQYMISGYTRYIDVETKQEYEFKKGDFFVIEPNTSYAQKIKKGTEILFFKSPPGNDKVAISSNEYTEKWLLDSIKTIRTDYYHDSKAPVANSIKPATSAVIMNDKREILFLKRKDNTLWTLPGGTLKNNESLVDCIRREVLEETGLNIKVEKIIGTYSDPNIIISYNDGEVRREFTIVYFATADTFQVRLDNESLEYRWVAVHDALNLALAESQKVRIEDVLNFLDSQEKVFLR